MNLAGAKLLLSLMGQASEPDTANSLDPRQSRLFAELYKREAQQYGFALVEEPVDLTLRPDPVFQWSNPYDNNFNGALFVAERGEGRPQVLMAVWSSHRKTADGQRRITHEFLTLADTPIAAKRNGSSAWSPMGVKLEFQPVPDAPTPAKTAQHRLLQVRSLGRQFSAHELREGKLSALQLLPKPVYEFGLNSEQGYGGALFVFHLDYDPELFLIIENRKTDSGSAWHYVFVHFALLAIQAKHQDVEVWTYPLESQLRNQLNHHYSNPAATQAEWILGDPAEDHGNP